MKENFIPLLVPALVYVVSCPFDFVTAIVHSTNPSSTSRLKTAKRIKMADGKHTQNQ